MRIELLTALNGDCILVEYTPNHFILIDGRICRYLLEVSIA